MIRFWSFRWSLRNTKAFAVWSPSSALSVRLRIFVQKSWILIHPCLRFSNFSIAVSVGLGSVNLSRNFFLKSLYSANVEYSSSFVWFRAHSAVVSLNSDVVYQIFLTSVTIDVSATLLFTCYMNIRTFSIPLLNGSECAVLNMIPLCMTGPDTLVAVMDSALEFQCLTKFVVSTERSDMLKIYTVVSSFWSSGISFSVEFSSPSESFCLWNASRYWLIDPSR